MRLSPNLSDIRLSHAMLGDQRVLILTDAAFRALMQMVRYAASGLVWTYSEPGDGSLPDDDERLNRLAGTLSPRRWRKIRPEIEPFFKIKDGHWHLNEPWIEVGGGGRLAIPSSIRNEVAAREGERCSYCGATDRPLEYDHIFPVSRGGTNDASNLTLACDSCNRSKGARTLAEWIDGRP